MENNKYEFQVGSESHEDLFTNGVVLREADIGDRLIDIDGDDHEPVEHSGSMRSLSICMIIAESGKLALPMMLNSGVSNSSSFVAFKILSGMSTQIEEASSLMTIMEWTLPFFSSTLQAVATLASESYGEYLRIKKEKYPDLFYGHRGCQLLCVEMDDVDFTDIELSKPLERIGQLFRNGYCMAALICVPAMLTFGFSEQILVYAFGQDRALSKIAGQFCRTYVLAIPAYLALLNTIQISNSLNQQGAVLACVSLGCVTGISLGYMLTFGSQALGLSGFGVRGMAMGITAQYWVTLAALLTYLKVSGIARRFRLFERGGISWGVMGDIWRIGWKIMAFVGTEIGNFFAQTLIVGKIGNEQLGAQQVAQQFLFLQIVPAFALSEASNILVSRYRGLRKYADMRAFGNVNIVMGLGYGLAVASVFILIPKIVISSILDPTEPENIPIIQHAVGVMRYVSVGMVFDNVRVIAGGALRGLEDVYLTFGMSLFNAMVSTFMSWYLGVNEGLGLPAVIWSRNAGLLMGAIVLPVWWWHRSREESSIETWITHLFEKINTGCRSAFRNCGRDQTRSSRWRNFAGFSNSARGKNQEDTRLIPDLQYDVPMEDPYSDSESDYEFTRSTGCTIL